MMTDIEEFFARRRPVDFEGMVILTLPENLACRPLEKPNMWYGSFDPDTIEARLVVMAMEYNLARGADWRAGIDDIIASMWRDFPERRMEIRPTDDGFFSYCGYNELESEEPEDPNMDAAWRCGPVHYHWWRVLRCKNDEARMIDALLSVPQPRADVPELRALAELVHAEIKKADFPGFEKRQN